MILINHGAEPFVIARGERIAQMIVSPVVQSAWIEVETLDETVAGRWWVRIDGALKQRA